MTNTQPQRECGQVMATCAPQTDQIHLFITEIQMLSIRALKLQQGHKLTMGFRLEPKDKGISNGCDMQQDPLQFHPLVSFQELKY